MSALVRLALAEAVVVPVTGVLDAGLEGGVAGVGEGEEPEARLLPLGTVVAVTMPRGIPDDAAIQNNNYDRKKIQWLDYSREGLLT